MNNHPIPLRRPAVVAILLAVLIVAVLILLPSAALAVFESSGAGGCGDFLDSYNKAADGDVLLPMVGGTNSGNPTITKTIVIQGGWAPDSGDCNSNGRSVFTDTLDLLNSGFKYDPTALSRLSEFGSILALDPRLHTLAIRQVSLEFGGNGATTGGGITGVLSDGADVLLENVKFSQNEVANAGFGMGGGLYLEVRGGSRLVIADSEFSENIAAESGGGFEIRIYDNSQVIIRNTRVTTNTASGANGGGGHIVIQSGSVIIRDSLFADNKADNGSGGGLSIERIGSQGQATATLINTTFNNNSAQNAGNPHVGTGVTAYILNPKVFVPLAVRGPVPTGGGVTITDISLDGSSYSVAFQTLNFQMSPPPSQHVHFFFNTVPVDQAGMPGTGPWKVYYEGSPFTEYGITARPPGATQMCIVVANPDHTIRPNTASCVDLP